MDRMIAEGFDDYLRRMRESHAELTLEDKVVKGLAYSAYLFGVGVGMQIVTNEMRKLPDKEVVQRGDSKEPETVHPSGTEPGTLVPKE
jgi:hypothetical protein